MRHRRKNSEVADWLASLVGKEFGWLTVLENIPCRPRKVRCQCRCGKEVTLRIESFSRRRSPSCGCKRFAKPTTWRCRVCKRTLPFDNDHFTTDRHNIHGLKWDCKDCDRKSCREYGRRLRHEVLMHYGNGHPACACCGEDNVVFLCLDHINNDGKQDRQKWGPGVGFYLMLKRQGFPGHLQILCYNCNMGRALLGRCPHHPSW